MITAADQARRKGLVPVCRESNTEGDNCTQQGKRRDTLPLDRLHKREADRSRKPNKQRQGKAGIKTVFCISHAAKHGDDKQHHGHNQRIPRDILATVD